MTAVTATTGPAVNVAAPSDRPHSSQPISWRSAEGGGLSGRIAHSAAATASTDQPVWIMAGDALRA